ncbi:MAG: glycosyltransferase [Chitinophagales bacterium]|nr:glycosyltransferase [Chitinophagales bacterium]
MLQEQHVHIIAFDVPSPPDYGGVIEIYYKIACLVNAGVKVHLHSFIYGRQVSKRLAEMCEQVYYYPRKLHPLKLLDAKPFIVATRSDETLLRNLVKDDYPIIFEGIHTCFFLAHPMLRERKKLVRLHNIEHDYYSSLAALEKNLFRRWYFRREAKRLAFFEDVLGFADIIACISEADKHYYLSKYGKKVHYIPCFHANKEILPTKEEASFFLYHGNLSVNENRASVEFLLDTLGNEPYKIIIAGKNPSKHLVAKIGQYPNVELRKNPNQEEMLHLLRTAHIHLLPFQIQCGAKIKLVNALYSGKFIITNTTENTGLSTVFYANTHEQWKDMIKQVYPMKYSSLHEKERMEYLRRYDNQKNTQALISLLWC